MNKKGANIIDWVIGLVLGLVLLAIVLKFFPGIIVKSADAAHAGLECGGQQEGVCMETCPGGTTPMAILGGCGDDTKCCVADDEAAEARLKKASLFNRFVHNIKGCAQDPGGDTAYCDIATTLALELVNTPASRLSFSKQGDHTIMRIQEGSFKQGQPVVLDEQIVYYKFCVGNGFAGWGDVNTVELYYKDGSRLWTVTGDDDEYPLTKFDVKTNWRGVATVLCVEDE